MNALSDALKKRIEQLEMAQGFSLDAILKSQFHQLAFLVKHCAAHSPYFANRLQEAGLTLTEVSTPDGFNKLPLLSRRHLQDAGDSLFCKEVPENHGSISKIQTSGSTGEPVVVLKTGLNQLNWFATNLQDHLWHKRDFSKRLCAIRPHIKAYTKQEKWGPPADILFKTGAALALPVTAGIDQLSEWIHDFEPHNLIIYPSTLKALTEHCLKQSIIFRELQHIRTIGETLSREIRQAASNAFNAKVEDVYSSQEVGIVALQCPESGLYHVSTENLIVEVLNDRGEPCKPSEIGRIVITDLHNFATPLIRYDIRDYAEVGSPCPCGRGSLTLKRIRGRERNLIMMPSGKRHWPLTGFMSFREIAPIHQYQLIQETLEMIEVRLVSTRTLTQEEEHKLGAVIQNALDYPFGLRFTYFETQIPTGQNGKFEEFICRVPSSK